MISKEELLNKMNDYVPGIEEPPTNPPQWPPDINCDKCAGTGWKWSDRYERYFICECCLKEEKPQPIYRLPYKD